MNPEPRLLLCTNGAPVGLPALDYGVWLADLIKFPITILGITEDPGSREAVQEAAAHAQAALETRGLHSVVDLARGDFLEVLGTEAVAQRDLVIMGPLGRPRWRRWLRGTSFRHIAHAVQAPLLYVKEARGALKKVLICLGGLGYAHSAEQLALLLAQEAGAQVALLHVVEPIVFEYPTARDIHKHAGQILESYSPQGKNLREAIERARASGFEPTFIERSGEVVHEILAEVEAGGYDLVAMGTPDSSQSLRHRFKPNVMAKLAEAISPPVLVVRAGQGLNPD